MKILLIIPATGHLRVQPGAPVPKRNMLRFSVLSATTVAALTPPEHPVTICDENVQALDFDSDADVVGVSFMTACAPRAYEIADQFRRRGKITVAGGFHPTFRPDEAATHFDIVVRGEAEELWPKVLQDIQARNWQKVYEQPSPPDLAMTPIPRRDLTRATSRHYATTNAVQTGRGCRHACKFCSVTAFAHATHRTRPLEHVLEELRHVPRHFMFVDDNIIADREYAIALFRAMLPMRKRWVSQCSIEIADDPELLRLAAAAGCRGLFVGIETLSEANLQAMEKGFNDSRGYRQRIARIHDHGICVQAGMIVGLDGDDVSVFERNLRFLQRAGIDALQLAILTPQPGTPLYDEFHAAGRIIDHNWAHHDYRHVIIQPARMTPQQLQNGADWLYCQFYRLDRIILRTLRVALTLGFLQAYLMWRLNLTYRYDNRREGLRGRNPAARNRWKRLWAYLTAPARPDPA